MTRIVRLLTGGILIAATGLGGCESVPPGPQGPSVVRVRNASTAELLDVLVLTGQENSRVAVARLAAGAQTGYQSVDAVHSTPSVRARVDGRDYMLHPVEGFDAFNPPQADGRYTVELLFSTAQGLGMRLVRDD